MPLFVEFAVAHALNTGIQTVSRGYSAVISNVRGSQPKIDESKIMATISEIRNSILTKHTEEEYASARDRISSRVETLDDKLRIVSGKDFILPMQNFEAYRVASQRMTTKSLMLRLAKYCDLTQLADIRERCTVLASEGSSELASGGVEQCHPPEPPPETC